MGQESNDSHALVISWALFFAALVVGALCVSNGDAHRVGLAPGQATPAQVEETAAELESLMRAEGLPENEIRAVMLRHRCKYLPDEEGCDGAEEGEGR